MVSRGVQIKAARAMLGMTRADLARRAGLHPTAVMYWERTVPTPPPYAVGAMEKALGELGVVAFTDPYPGVQLSTRDNFMTHARTRERAPSLNGALKVAHAGEGLKQQVPNT